ncbi:hypothetical protein [Rhodocytophaga aerolata]|uniref:hypothetical protein n=1 Tax=Rhodocytophaga aerolata TaxID=455078 RepID=UPI00366C1B46
MDTMYIYLGDKLTDTAWKGKLCRAIRKNGKCIRSKKGTMLVELEGRSMIVLARLLRKQ